MNKIILMGRLTRDPEVRYTTTGRAVCQFALAVNRPFTNQVDNVKPILSILLSGVNQQKLPVIVYLKDSVYLLKDAYKFAVMMEKTTKNIMLLRLLQIVLNLSKQRIINLVLVIKKLPL